MEEDKIIVECRMLIRKPVTTVFHAFIDPTVTTKFWFTKSSGKLEPGAMVTWSWEMYGATAEVSVLRLVQNELIAISWGENQEKVEFIFKPSADGAGTYVVIRNYGFAEKGDALLRKLIDTTGGFTTVLDGAKCWLEHGTVSYTHLTLPTKRIV